MDIDRWIKKHSDTYIIAPGAVTGPMIRVKDLRELLKTHDVVPKISRETQPHSRPELGDKVTTPYAKPYDRRCPECQGVFRTDDPGARWTTRSGNPRYLHPACPAGAKPVKGWRQA